MWQTIVKAYSQCDICADPARWRLNGFGVVCDICKPEVMADLSLSEEEDVKRL